MELRAHLRMLTTAEGGRQYPFVSGYRPDVNFEPPADRMFGINMTFEQESIHPGEEVDIVIEPRVPELWKEDWLRSSATFRVCEGARVVAIGTVLGPVLSKKRSVVSPRTSI